VTDRNAQSRADGAGDSQRVILRGVDAGGRNEFAPFMPFDFADSGGANFDAALAAYMDRAAATRGSTRLKSKDEEGYLERYDEIIGRDRSASSSTTSLDAGRMDTRPGAILVAPDPGERALVRISAK
jgi:hypothetical protein